MEQNKALLFSNAKSVFSNAYAPYSKFNVSVSLLGKNTSIYTGVNVENSAFPQGMCAEAAAIGKMVTDGCTEIYEILVMADTKKPTTPCGGCRQSQPNPQAIILACNDWSSDHPASKHVGMILASFWHHYEL